MANFILLALKSLKDAWQKVPPSWVGTDPCGDGWEGIECKNSHVTSIILTSMGLKGQLPSDVQLLSELTTLDLSYNKGLDGPLPSLIGNLLKLSSLSLVGCSFYGQIPYSIGSLTKLVTLSLNSNNFNGNIPPSIGNLTNLYWLDLADNQLTGAIPVSDGTSPGLDLLVNTRHFHFGNNMLSGNIPPQLFSSKMNLIHLLFESNQFTGSIPTTLGSVGGLEVLRLDNNLLSDPVPSNLNMLTSLHELYLSNNKLSASIPNLNGLNGLYYLDMSNNSFETSDIPPWFSNLQSLTTLMMESTQLQGLVSYTLFNLPNLQTVVLKNNLLNGTLDIDTGYSKQLHQVDLQGNLISKLTLPPGSTTFEIILVDNPICKEPGVADKYCTDIQSNASLYSTPLNYNCTSVVCITDQVLSPNCSCAYPYTGKLVFRAPAFSNLGDPSYYVSLESALMLSFQNHSRPVDSISLSNPTKNSINYLELSLKVFPSSQERFNRTGIWSVGVMFSTQIFKPPKLFGPYYFIADSYDYFPEESKASKNTLSRSVVIGAAVAGCVLVLLSLLAGVYAFRRKKRAEKPTDVNSFVSWDPYKDSVSTPQLKGAKCFSFEELRKCTNNFSEANDIGYGGYGKVYRGCISTGQLVAVKRAQQGSMQGGLEFKTEIELLSRVHHKNIVSLVGFCFDHGEQMLVYEYVPNGTLKDSLSGKSGIKMDWIRRLKVAVGTARGLTYLHEHANPPIIHRDVKSNNILLDERLNAKVADFGLSKTISDGGNGHVTTQVKGTMGYMDPEYYMTQQLTEKSDVYSFGVLMLELVTAKKPIERGKYIVRVVRTALDKAKDLYNLGDIVDPAIGLRETLIGFEKFIDLTMWCVEELGEDRPMMSEVLKEIENIMQLAGLNPHAESASTSASYEGARSQGRGSHPYAKDDFSAAFPS